MAAVFRTTRRVEFCHTDAAGMAHFSALFQFLEQAEHELLRSVGLSVSADDEQGTISWPRVSASCDFRRAARFEDLLEIEVQVARLGTTSVSYAFRLHSGGELVAEGHMTSVCCRLAPGEPPRPVAVPELFRARLAPFVA